MLATPFFAFGEVRPEFTVPVLNERAVRAAAGILFVFAMVAFMNAWLQGNFQPTRVFVVAFLLDFGVRILVNPRFSPSLILGQWMVRKQVPEWVGAPQKRFAWGIGLALALAMFFLMVVNQVVGPINLLVCVLCLGLMWLEAAMGICVGCKIYNALYPDKAQLCPGGVCEVPSEATPHMRPIQLAIVLLFGGLVAVVAQQVYKAAPVPQAMEDAASTAAPADTGRCTVPAFAKAMGHEKQWKLHNNC
jgi:hypothetical protein